VELLPDVEMTFANQMSRFQNLQDDYQENRGTYPQQAGSCRRQNADRG
jgi:hypothetical protein